jgi:hypothetical protein
MRFISRLLTALIGIASVGAAAGSPALAVSLASAQKSDFFGFFNLAASGAPVAAGPDAVWHSFRPTGSAFHALVEVDVLTDRQGNIVESLLGIDRAFVDNRANGVFARDLAKSFLTWAVPAPPPAPIAVLIANIADPTQSGARVIMREGAVTTPSPDTTGGYAVFLGKADRTVLKEAGFTLELANFAGAFPAERIYAPVWHTAAAQSGPRWLRLDVRPGKN